MKTLVDTCVWSLFLRRSGKAALNPEERNVVTLLAEATRDGRVAIIGPIRQEILSGIRDKSQFSKTEQILEPFPDEELTTADYVEAARLFNICRDRGVECGVVDILICAAAVRRGFDILTNDTGLLRCIQVLRAAKLLPSRNS
jgi:predicted nucleic acid-binding protein